MKNEKEVTAITAVEKGDGFAMKKYIPGDGPDSSIRITVHHGSLCGTLGNRWKRLVLLSG